MNTDPRNVQLPPVTALPDDLHQTVEQFHRLCQQWGDANTAAARLWNQAALDAAKNADQAAAVEAATNGRDPAAVGTPAQDDLHNQRDAARRTAEAYEQALDDHWNTQVAPALRRHAQAEERRWREERDNRAATVTDAIAVLRAAEQRWHRSCEMVAYYQRIHDNGDTSFGGLAVPTRGVQQPDRISAHLLGLEKGLVQVPALQDGPVSRYTEPEPEPDNDPKPTKKRVLRMR